MRTFSLLAAALVLAAPAAAEHHRGHAAKTPAAALSPAAQQALTPVIADARRDNDRARDAFRHPVETLAFFRVEPGMTVVDYMPSTGWWTRVLVPYLGTGGRYIGINPDSRTMEERMRTMFANLGGTLPAKAAEWTGVPAERVGAYNTDGLLGIEQHRARADASADYTNGSKGYLREKDVIALVEAHGFALVGKSEINANRADPANHPGGVWMLPPGLRGVADADKPRMQAIGESDRMTLLFRKRP